MRRSANDTAHMKRGRLEQAVECGIPPTLAMPLRFATRGMNALSMRTPAILGSCPCFSGTFNKRGNSHLAPPDRSAACYDRLTNCRYRTGTE